MAGDPVSVGPWRVLRKLGEGGQGTVYLVQSPNRAQEVDAAFRNIGAVLSRSGSAYGSQQEREEDARLLAASIDRVSRDNWPAELGAGKVYRIPGGPLADKAVRRLQLEFDVLAEVQSPHVLRVIYSDLDSKAMVTEYYPETLESVRERFRGKPLAALRAFKGIVSAVAELHSSGVVHRDIKPANIFVAHDGRLVLGDFGIVFVEDGKADRLTDTFEKVGTRDWMPHWSHTGTRIDEVKPSFDVFSLGKVLWWMLSGSPMLQLWYWSRPAFDLTKKFPNEPGMAIVNELLRETVVQEEGDCLSDARELLQRVETAITTLEFGGQLMGKGMRCRVCGLGRYVRRAGSGKMRVLPLPEVDAASTQATHLVGEMPPFSDSLVVETYVCDYCGNVQMFHFPDGGPPEAWDGREEE